MAWCRRTLDWRGHPECGLARTACRSWRNQRPLSSLIGYIVNSNNVRFDLSPFLIHFFRKVDIGQADVRCTPENWGPGDLVEDTTLSPLFMIRNSLRLKRLWATWSVRKRRRTVYGPNPAVCFTDMPIAAFIEAGRARAKKGEAMSPIALVLPKNQVHAAGARPVIYGLSSEFAVPNGENNGPACSPQKRCPSRNSIGM